MNVLHLITLRGGWYKRLAECFNINSFDVLQWWETLWADWEVGKNVEKYQKPLFRNGKWNNGVTEAGVREPVDGKAESEWS